MKRILTLLITFLVGANQIQAGAYRDVTLTCFSGPNGYYIGSPFGMNARVSVRLYETSVDEATGLAKGDVYGRVNWNTQNCPRGLPCGPLTMAASTVIKGTYAETSD